MHPLWEFFSQWIGWFGTMLCWRWRESDSSWPTPIQNWSDSQPFYFYKGFTSWGWRDWRLYEVNALPSTNSSNSAMIFSTLANDDTRKMIIFLCCFKSGNSTHDIPTYHYFFKKGNENSRWFLYQFSITEFLLHT